MEFTGQRELELVDLFEIRTTALHKPLSLAVIQLHRRDICAMNEFVEAIFQLVRDGSWRDRSAIVILEIGRRDTSRERVPSTHTARFVESDIA